MTLRDPDRIYRGRRIAIIKRFVTGAHVAEADAESWVAEWEKQAAAVPVARNSAGYWDAGLRWIASRRADSSVHGATPRPS